MQLQLVLALFFVACLTVLSGYLPCSDAAPTERPYQFGFTTEKQQHRQEKKDERGIVMGEFGFITADGIYHVTVYATDEEGKFRILAMRSYPYEEHPKTIDMVVRPKAKPTTPKAITTSTTTERAKAKPIAKHNFSVQGCSGCFIKNNIPTTTTTTTQKPEDKKHDIRPLSQPLAPREDSKIGKTIISQISPQVLQVEQNVDKKLKKTPANVPPKIVKNVALDIGTRKSGESIVNRKSSEHIEETLAPSQKPQLTQSTTQKAHEVTQKIQSKTLKTLETTQRVQGTTQKLQAATQNEVKSQEVQATTQKEPPMKQKVLVATHKAEATTQQIQTISKVQDTNQKAQTTQIALPVKSLDIQTQKATTSLETLSTNTNRLSPTLALSKGSAAPPSKTVNSNTAKPSIPGTFGGPNTPKAPAKTQSNALPNSLNAPSAGATGSTNGFTTPKKELAPPAIPASNTGGTKGTIANGTIPPNTSTGFGVGSNGNANSGGTGSDNKGGTANETGDLYRFKYDLDYNGHRETGARNGNKEGSFYAIGDDNVERTIEYIANEFGYQPRIRFRKLDAPLQVKENTLKDYEFVWFKEA